jgi:hypothetical protein
MGNINNINNVNNMTYNSGKLINFDEQNKINMNNSLSEITDNKIKSVVISNIGNARVGKSTFINGLISYLFGKNITLAQTSSGKNHCTTGIDFIVFSCDVIDMQIIILDCQGLSYEDSKNDDKLLSLIYSLSNIIIYHEIGIINNQTLNTLTPLCLIADYIKHSDNEKKPFLFFRMRDYNFDCDPIDVIDNTFKIQNDQYDNVRGAINKLFPNIDVIKTDPIGKNEQNEIRNNNFMSILNNDDYGFNSAYDKILKKIANLHIDTVEILYNKLEYVIKQINSNENISYDNYDYYTVSVKLRFDAFKNKIDGDVYVKVSPTEKQKTYDTCLKKLEKINNIINEFTKKFSEVNQKMIDDEILKLKTKLEKPVLESMLESEKLANIKIHNEVTKFIQKDIFNNLKNILNNDISNNKIIIEQNIQKLQLHLI